ncbi:MAG: dTDP-4-dehydrorhamnose reductase, partial [Haliea sp.]
MKILLFGRDGQLGQALQHSLAPLGEVVALGRAPGPVVDGQALCGDVLDAEGVAQTIGRVRPDVVVNAAAYTAVDRAAQEPALAWAVNSAAPLAMARAAAAHGAWLVHYSTDYVFDGTGSRPWHEADLPSPRNVYGHSKLAGDDGVRAACPRHLILRTSWLYSLVRPNFASAVLRKMTTQDELQIVADQVGAPTSAERVAAITVEALRGAVSSSTPMAVGTYHLAAAGETSWFDYA